MRNRMKGSFTIEAALILPIVLLVIMTLIYFAFFLHDRNRMQVIADKALHKATMSVKHLSDVRTGEVDYQQLNERGVSYWVAGATEGEELQREKYLEEEYKKGFFCTEVTGVKVTIGRQRITVFAEGRIHIPISGLMKYFRFPKSMTITVEGSIHNPAELIRSCSVILETGQRIKNMDKLEELIGSLAE